MPVGSDTIINGTKGNDNIIGTAGNDLIRAGTGQDSADGLDGDDYLDGGAGDDVLLGGNGVDWLFGNAGNDIVTGGRGADQFFFLANQISGVAAGTPSHDVDTITDLTFAEGDVLVLAHFAAGTFKGTDINGQLDLVDNNGGVNVRSWAGLVDLVKSTPAVSASRDGTTDTLLVSILNADGARQTIAIQNGWAAYSQLVNHAPVAVSDTALVMENAAIAGSVLTNDGDADGDTLLVATAGGATMPASGTLVVNGIYGALTIHADGSYSYAANSAAAEALGDGVLALDRFAYSIVDAAGATATAELAITVQGVNDAPVAKALAATIGENGAPVKFTADFTDVDAGDTHSISVNAAQTKGKVILNADGSFSYDANGKFANLKYGQSATDSFTYTVTDAKGAASTQTVTVTVLGENDNPLARADIAGVQKNATITANALKGVLANDSDGDGGTLSVAAINGSAANVGKAIAGTYGTLTLKADGSYSYTANSKVSTLPDKQVAQDSFTYTVSDGQGGTATATLTITVGDKDQGYKSGTDGCDLLINILGNDILDGGNGNDVIIGGLCNDQIIGGAGNDVLTGSFGRDTFVFGKNHGNDVIVDYGFGGDTIQFDKAVFQNFAQVLAASKVVGNTIVIDTGGGNSITLWFHNSLGDLKAGDFLFV